jgi:hypothetical protein
MMIHEVIDSNFEGSGQASNRGESPIVSLPLLQALNHREFYTGYCGQLRPRQMRLLSKFGKAVTKGLGFDGVLTW